MSRNSEDLKSIDEFTKSVNQQIDEVIKQIDNGIKKLVNKNDVAVWEQIRDRLENVQWLFGMIQELSKRVSRVEGMVEMDRKIITKISAKFPDLETEVEQLKKQKSEVELIVPSNIKKALEEFLKQVERAKEAQSHYVS